MTVSFVGAQGAATTTVTIPTHQVGDLILLFAYRDGSNTAPTTPTAGGTVPTWNLIGSIGGNTNSANFRWAIATATNTTSGTWTGATELICLVYRGASVGASATAGANTATITYPALTLQRSDGSSWVVGVAGHRTATNVELAPTGMTNRISSGTEAAGHDTNGTVTSWSQQTVTVNASNGNRSWTVELKDKTVTLLADVGTFAVTGVNADVIKAAPKLLTADSGTLSVSGVAANIAALHLLPANKGSILCSGVPAGVLRKAVIGASSGTYTISEKTANLVKRITLIAVKGSLLCNGQDAALRIQRKILGQSGVYSVSAPGLGSPFLRGGRLAASTGSFSVLGGSNTTVIYTPITANTITAAPGNIGITGIAAAITRSCFVVAQPGSIIITGRPIASTDERPVAFKLNVTDPSILAVDPNFTSTSQFSIYKKIRIL